MIGAQREVDPETSETSSYCSSRNPDSEDSDDGDVMEEEKLSQKKNQKKQGKKLDTEINLDLLDDIAEPGDDDRTSTYSKFKTQNELDLEKAL